MFDWSKGICNKIKDSNCLTKHELEMVEISLRLYECYSEVLDENLGLDLRTKEINYFQLEHAIHRNSIKEKDWNKYLENEGSNHAVGCQCKGVM